MIRKKKPIIADEHLARHDFLNYCKWCLISIVEYADKNNLAKETIHFKNKEDAIIFDKICSSTDIDRDKWLIDNGYKHDLYNFYFKHLYFSLVVDFSNYFTVSMENAFSGNINVAWSLLRKPFQETLAYFEWLYVDKEELVSLMMESNNPADYEIMSKKFKEKRKSHIQAIQSPEITSVIDMYSFRYSYDEYFTLNGILQATNHLITSRPALKTAPSGLNYVFANEQIVKKNIGYYYTTVPYTMFYTLDIVFNLFNKIANLNDYTILMNSYNLMLKNLKASESFSLEEAIEHIEIKLPIFCPKCGNKMDTVQNWQDFVYFEIKCSQCNKKINTFKYIFDFEKLKFPNNMEEHTNDK